MSFSHWMQIVAGTGIFLFAMLLLEESLRLLAGRKFKLFLQRQTSGKVKGIIGGTIVTSVLESSSIVSVMVLSFVGAGIISMRNALPLILGANLGTTLDSWVVALLGFRLDLEAFAYPIIGLAFIGFAFFQNKLKIFNFSRFLMGFALVFIGLEFMKDGAAAFVNSFDVKFLSEFSVWVFIIAGFILTAIIQSSSAAIALTLTSLHAGILSFPQATGIVIGSELGTTIKLILGSLGGIPDKKRLAAGNFFFNVITVAIAVALLNPLIWFILEIIKPPDLLMALVIFQTMINLLGIVIIFPFINAFSVMLEKMFKSQAPATAVHLGTRDIRFPEDFIRALEIETTQFIKEALLFNEEAFGINTSSLEAESILKRNGKIDLSDTEHYNSLKILQGDIIQKVAAFPRDEFTPEEARRLDDLILALRLSMHTVKEIKDIRHNLRDMADSSGDFIYTFYLRLLVLQQSYYEKVIALIADKNIAVSDIADLMQQVEQNNTLMTNELFEASGKRNLEKLEVSSLLNVIRGVYSSSRDLLRALALYYKLPLDE